MRFLIEQHVRVEVATLAELNEIEDRIYGAVHEAVGANLLEHEDGSTGDSSIEGLDAESREALDVAADALGD